MPINADALTEQLHARLGVEVLTLATQGTDTVMVRIGTLVAYVSPLGDGRLDVTMRGSAPAIAYDVDELAVLLKSRLGA